MKIEADRDEIARFVAALFQHADTDTFVSLRAFRDDADGAWGYEHWSTVRINGDGFGALVDAAFALASACAAAAEAVVFAPPIATFNNADKADAGSLANGLVITVEIDADPATAREKLEAVLGTPTIAMQSGGLWIDQATGEPCPKQHVHWRLAQPTRTPIEHDFLREINRLATTLAGGDPSAIALVHPLRWPGSVHRKATPRLARIVAYNPEIEIALDEALAKLRAAVEVPHHTPGRKRANGPDPTAWRPTVINGANDANEDDGRPTPAELLDICSALAVIPNDDSGPPQESWDRWNAMGLRIYAALGDTESAEGLFVDWSQRSKAKFDEDNTRARWRHYATSPPNRTGPDAIFKMAREAWPGWERPSDTRRRRDNDPGDPPRRITEAPNNTEPGPAGPEPEAPRRNGQDREADAGSADPSVGDGDDDDRATQAQRRWGSAAPALSFRDPWAEPPRPQWPTDVLPVKYHDMLFELAYGAGVDPGAQGVAALCSVSGAAPKNAHFFPYGTTERWIVPPIIWAMIIAPSGQRKTALNSVFEALQRKHSLLWREYRTELRAWRALSNKERNNTPKPSEPHSFLVTDATPEKVQHILAETDRGTLWLRDELAGFFGFGRYGNDKAKAAAERAFYLESYEGGSYTVHRVTRDSFLIEVNGLTVFGHIQPDRLNDFPDLQNDGLLQRFITIRAAQATVGHPLGTITGKSEFDATIGRLAELRPNSARPYHTNQEGGDIVRRMEVAGIEFATLTDYGPGFSGFCGKLHGTLARLALILHLLGAPDYEQTLISPDTVLAAERLVREFVLPHARDFYATLSPDRGDLTRDIAGWLLTNAPAQIRASDFGKHIWACRGLDGDALNAALDPLVTGGWLDPETPFPSNRKWRLHPQVRAVMAHRAEVAAARREANRQLAERIGRREDEK